MNIEKMKFISLDSLNVVNDPKDKNQFIIETESKNFHLKPKSKADLEGWVYSIRKYSDKAKFRKRVDDENRKILLTASKQINVFKTICTQMLSSTNMIFQSRFSLQSLQEIRRALSDIDQPEILLMIEYLIDVKKGLQLDTIAHKYQQLIQILKQQEESNQMGKFMTFMSKRSKLNEITKLYTEPQFTVHARIMELLSQYLDRFYFDKIKKETQIIPYLGTIPLKKFSSAVHFRKPILDILFFDLQDEQDRPHTARDHDPMIFHFNQI